MTAPPFAELAYLYVGTRDVAGDLAYYRDVLGAVVVWDFARFGARVAAVRLAPGPLYVLADHRPAPSCMPIFAVADLRAAARELTARGWRPDAGPFELPDGPCYTFSDRSGNQLALLEQTRPGALESAAGRGGSA